jgi:hypothetical protein
MWSEVSANRTRLSRPRWARDRRTVGDRLLWMRRRPTWPPMGFVMRLPRWLPWAALNTFRDGWAVRCEFFLDWDEGLRALAADPAEVPDPA